MDSKIKTKFLSIIMLMGLFSGACFSQGNAIHNVTDRDQRFAPGDIVANRSATATQEIPTDLLYDLKSTIYVKNNGISKVTGAAPLVLQFKDTKSFNVASKSNALFNKVEMIKIDIASTTTLNTPFNLSSTQGFNNLKYIYLNCEFPVTEDQIRSFIQNADPEIIIFYNIYKRS
ncbi:hypothetical protein [Gelidibacter salicanalis]|uniref:Lipoprotein n=1 Tax=Gelidibacter salicanalis TaxID=291193 RepID=A0A934KSG6_9FLAO|nr:hypothetical protein [Gelidibacter salicanalis]MBJ7882744.1 hypothetical protein [Gelidibacter salicanalis]